MSILHRFLDIIAYFRKFKDVTGPWQWTVCNLNAKTAIWRTTWPYVPRPFWGDFLFFW